MKRSEYNNMTLTDLEAKAGAIRSETKEFRSKWRDAERNLPAIVASPSRDAVFQGRIDRLDGILEELHLRVATAQRDSNEEKRLNKQLADCYGAKGGIYRDWERYSEAVNSYGLGRKFEIRAAEFDVKETNSYCLVQGLVNRMLAAPEDLHGDVELRVDIEAAYEEVKEQVDGVRNDDPWAWADYALLTLLLEPRSSIAKWRKFKDLTSKGGFSRSSTHDALKDISEKLRPYLDEKEIPIWERSLGMIV